MMLLLLLQLLPTAAAAWQVCDVTKHGAKGDNRTKDTAAIKAAIAACATDGGEILLPAPGKYLTGALNLSSNQLLRVEPGAALLASQDVADYPAVASFPSYEGSRDIPNSTCRYGAVVGAVGATNVSITGGGLIDGQGWHFWALVDANHVTPGTLNCSRPHLIEFENSSDISLRDLTLQNSPFWTSHFIYSRRIHASELTILAPATRGNTDGINPDSSTDITIENCYISNGDDGIAIKSGLNAAGIAVGLPSANIFIRNVTTEGRGGIAIGSEMSGGVKNVTMENVRLLGQRGVHMKTTRGRGGYIENITMINVEAKAGIQLWSTYGSTVKDGPWPHVGNITIINTSSSCSLGCGKLPSAYCDPKSFYYSNACGHHGPPIPPPPPAPLLKLAPCADAGAASGGGLEAAEAAQEWSLVSDGSATAGFIVSKSRTGVGSATTAFCVDVGRCQKQPETTPVHMFSVQEAMYQVRRKHGARTSLVQPAPFKSCW
jgi:polygalacturonase